MISQRPEGGAAAASNPRIGSFTPRHDDATPGLGPRSGGRYGAACAKPSRMDGDRTYVRMRLGVRNEFSGRGIKRLAPLESFP